MFPFRSETETDDTHSVSYFSRHDRFNRSCQSTGRATTHTPHAVVTSHLAESTNKAPLHTLTLATPTVAPSTDKAPLYTHTRHYTCRFINQHYQTQLAAPAADELPDLYEGLNYPPR